MSALRGPRRKPPRTQQSASSLADLGGLETPPLVPPLSYYPESDMRSTTNDFMPPHRADTDTDHHVRPDADPDSAIYESSDEDTLDHLSPPAHQFLIYPTWTPINNPSERPRKLPLDLAAFSLRNGYSLANAELRMNEIFEDEFENVDRKDGLVYHQGHKCQDHDGSGTSYSFVWLDDDPEALPGQVQLWKDRKTKEHRALEGPALEKNIRRMLETGSALVIERIGSEPSPEGAFECLLPECRYGSECLPPGYFYLTLRPGREKWQSKPFCFCLGCFERLWMGNFSDNPGPAGIRVLQDSNAEPQPARNRLELQPRIDTPFVYSNELTLDGPMDALDVEDSLRNSSLYASRHAPPEDASSPVHRLPEEIENVINCSPCSTNSRGDWIAQTVRVQHLAGFIKPGESLSQIEKAAVNLWKAASFEQLQWDLHQLRTKYRREYQAGDALVDKGLKMEECQTEDVDGEMIDEIAAEKIVKLPQSRFRGCSLADVWMVMRKEAVCEFV